MPIYIKKNFFGHLLPQPTGQDLITTIPINLYEDCRLALSSSCASSSRNPNDGRRLGGDDGPPFSLPAGAEATDVHDSPDSEDRRSEVRRSRWRTWWCWWQVGNGQRYIRTQSMPTDGGPFSFKPSLVLVYCLGSRTRRNKYAHRMRHMTVLHRNNFFFFFT